VWTDYETEQEKQSASAAYTSIDTTSYLKIPTAKGDIIQLYKYVTDKYDVNFKLVPQIQLPTIRYRQLT